MLGYSWGWLVTLLLIIAAVVAICFAPIRIHAEFKRSGSDDIFKLDFRTLFGLLHFNWNIPMFRLTSKGIDVRNQTNLDQGLLNTETQSKKRVTPEKIKGFISLGRQLLMKTDNLTGLARYTLSHVEIRKWEWRTVAGTGDAMWTAMSIGMIWSFKTSVIGALSQLMRLKATPHVSVEPEYRGACLSTGFTCIAQIRFGYAILAGLQLLVRIMKVKGGLKLWQNILFKA